MGHTGAVQVRLNKKNSESVRKISKEHLKRTGWRKSATIIVNELVLKGLESRTLLIE